MYLLPYLASLGIALALSIYTWRHRHVPGAKYFAIFLPIQVTLILGFILELLSPTLIGKIFWDDFQWIGTLLTPVVLLAFAYDYSRQTPSHARLLYTLLTIIALVFLLFIYTDPWHRLIRPLAQLTPGEPFAALIYAFLPIIWLMILYIYGVIFWALGILLRSLIQAPFLYRRQTTVIIIGILIPLIGAVLTLLGVIMTFQRDVAPITLALGNLVIAWGLFRYRIFDLIPIARDAVIDHMGDAVVILDQRHRIIDLNPEAKKLMGDDVLGERFMAAHPHWSNFVHNNFDDGEIQTEIIQLVTHGRRDFELRLMPLANQEGLFLGHLAIIRDVTERVQSERDLAARTLELEQLNAQLEEANRHLQVLSQVKDEFVTNVSHELRTPITSLKLYLSLMAINPKKRERYTTTLMRETVRLENMIEALLQLSRLDQERIVLERIAVDVNKLVQNYVTDRTPLAKQKQQKLNFHLEPDLPLALADLRLMGMVLSILLTNSMNYTPSGGEIVVATAVKCFGDEYYPGFSVSDTGPGIPLAEQDRLFERFYRGKIAQEQNIPGTGLGLSIANEIVRRHNGFIEVESRGIPGKGVTFCVWIPAVG